MNATLCTLLAASALLAPPSAGASAAELARLDELYLSRDDAAQVEPTRQAIEALLASRGSSFPVVWRAARHFAWFAETSSDPDVRVHASGRARELGERAMALAPHRVEGWYYAAVGLGLWAREASGFRVAVEGVESKLLARLDRAIALDPSFEHGGPLVTRARYLAQVPWPKRDRKASSELLRRVLRDFPDNARAWLFLAENLAQDGDEAGARAATAGLSSLGASFDPPLTRWAKAQVRQTLALRR